MTARPPARTRRHFERLVRLLQRPLSQQWLVVHAFVLLGVTRYQIKRNGLKAVQERLGDQMVESPVVLPAAEQAAAAQIEWAIRNVRMYTPWSSNCFPQAVTAKRLLDKRGIASTVYFGAVLRAPEAALAAGASEIGAFAAHAWTRAGETYVSGGDVRHLYEPILWFGSTAGRSA